MIAKVCPELTMPESSFKLSKKLSMDRTTVSSSKGTLLPASWEIVQEYNCYRGQHSGKEESCLLSCFIHYHCWTNSNSSCLLLLTTPNKTKTSLICRHQINTAVLALRKTLPLIYKLRFLQTWESYKLSQSLKHQDPNSQTVLFRK